MTRGHVFDVVVFAIDQRGVKRQTIGTFRRLPPGALRRNGDVLGFCVNVGVGFRVGVAIFKLVNIVFYF